MAYDKTLSDINRRPIDFDKYRVREVLPSFFQEDYPLLVKLLEYYVDSLEEDDNPANVLNDLFAIRDVRQVPEDLLLFIGEEVLLGDPYFENFASKRLSVLFSNILYRSKGSRFSIEKFFKIFFNVDAEVEYPKHQIFTIGAPQKEVLEYDLSAFETIIGSNFSYAIRGDILVYIDDVLLVEDTDYIWNLDTKSISILTSLNEDLIEGSTLRIESTPDNFTLIGSDLQEKRILNNKEYQLFSLLIKSPLGSSEWGETYQKFVHPAGMYYASVVNVFSNVFLDISNQELSIPEAPEVVVDGNASLAVEGSLQYTDMTGIVSDSAGEATGLIRIPLEPITLSDAANTYADNTILELNRQYGTIVTPYNINPPLMSEDSAGTGLSRDSDVFIDISNSLEQLDQNIYHDSDGSLER